MRLVSLAVDVSVRAGLARVARGAVSGAADLLFPKRCVGCDQEGSFLCPSCRQDLPRLEPPYCFLCCQPGRLIMRLCPRCWGRPMEIDGIRAPYLMDGAVRNAVHALKYRDVRALAPTLGGILAEHMARERVPADVLVPVPLHGRRERMRGYNQSALLAREAGKAAGVAVEERALRRVRATYSQARSPDESQRWANVAGAFQAEMGRVAGKRVMLVDDVCTTGATLEACSLALKGAGAASVWGLVLAREA